jgi:hypothetical protein
LREREREQVRIMRESLFEASWRRQSILGNNQQNR